jgi:hypothetical protein
MKYAGDLTVYTLGGTAYLADFTNVSFKVSNKTEEGKGGADRHSTAVPVKRSFEARTEIMRTVTGVRQTALTLSLASVGATPYLAKVRSLTINVNTTQQECSGRADEFETYQATGTKITGSGTMQIADADTSTIMEVANGSLAGLSTTMSITAGGMTLVFPCVITSADLKVERDNLILVDFDWEQRGAPTTMTGNTLLTLVATGTTLVQIISTITTYGTLTGSTSIESATITIPESGLITEQYNFKGLGTLVKS